MGDSRTCRTDDVRAGAAGLCSRRARSVALAALLLASPASADILIGAGIPLSGRFAEQGRAIQRSLERSIESTNKAGGVHGEPLRLVLGDDGCEAKAGAEAARKLVAEKVAVVIGHPCGSAAMAAAPIYAEAKVLTLAISRHPELTDKRAGPTIFRFAGRDDRQGTDIAVHVLSGADPRSVALVHDRTNYGRGLVDGVAKALAGKGIVPLLNEGIVSGDKDFAAVVAKIKETGATTVVFGGFPTEAAILLRQVRGAGLTASFIAGDALAVEDFATQAGPVADGVQVALTWSYDGAGGGRLYGPAQAASALAIWALAARRTPQGGVVRMDEPISRPDGQQLTDFHPNGDLSVPSYRIHLWQNGRLVAPGDPK